MPHKARIQDGRVESTACGGGQRTDIRLAVASRDRSGRLVHFVLDAYVTTDYAMGTYDPAAWADEEKYASRRILLQMRARGTQTAREKAKPHLDLVWKAVQDEAQHVAKHYCIEPRLPGFPPDA